MIDPISQLWLATDFSPAAMQAGQRAVQLADEHAALLGLMHARERGGWIEALSSAALPPEFAERIEQERIAALQAEAQRLGCAGAEQRVLDEPLHRALPLLQHERPAQLLVMGARGSGGWQHLLLGSTADRVLRGQQLPVLLVRSPAAGPYRRIGIATDFSPASGSAARFALQLCPSATALLVHANELPFESTLGFAGVGRDTVEHYRSLGAREALRSLEAFAAALGPAGARALLALREGRPTDVFAALVEAADLDLLVLGAAGRSAIERGLLGSVSSHAAASLPCDVLVVPEAQRRGVGNREPKRL